MPGQVVDKDGRRQALVRPGCYLVALNVGDQTGLRVSHDATELFEHLEDQDITDSFSCASLCDLKTDTCETYSVSQVNIAVSVYLSCP